MRGLPRSLWLLMIGGAANSLGIAFLWSLASIYVHEVLGESMALAGLILTLQMAAGLAGSLLGGLLFDRYGARGPLLVSVAAAVVGMLGVAAQHTFLAYAVGAALVGMAVGVVFPILNALAGELWPTGGRHAFNLVYLAENVGVALGPLLAGLTATVNFSLTFLFGACLLATFWVVVLLGFRGVGFNRVEGREPASARERGQFGLRGLSWRVWLLAAGMVLNWVAYSQWITTTPTYLTREGVPLPLYSLLWTINGALILLGQPLIRLVVRRWPRVKTQILVGNALFVVSFLVLTLDHAYSAFVGGMVLSTFGEMLVYPGVPALADGEVPVGQRGAAQGLVSMAGFVGRMGGPLLGGALYSAVSPTALFGVMVGFMVLGGLVYAGYDTIGGRRASGPSPA